MKRKIEKITEGNIRTSHPPANAAIISAGLNELPIAAPMNIIARSISRRDSTVLRRKLSTKIRRDCTAWNRTNLSSFFIRIYIGTIRLIRKKGM
jgi:hypothetical protein